MVFSDLFFLFAFLPAFFLCYNIIGRVGKGCTARNMILIVFSLLFYAWGEPVYVVLMLASSVINYVAGKVIDGKRGKRKAALVAGVAINITILAIFKYLGFLIETFTGISSFIIGTDAANYSISDLHIALPIGISFYTFQSISYLVDVYRGGARAQKSYMGLLLYISMFPQLIAGPIVRYGTVETEITNRRATQSDMAEGLYRFAIGLAKKVIIANQLSEISAQMLDNPADLMSQAGAWVGLLAFSLQIYYDFSGYSDMAIGLGRCMGFHFNENFNHPYCCGSVTDFWRRWHMSLGSFFRDYVYIPMGGNRRHQPINILVVWFLTGMWHGASWNFIIWGLWFGFFVMIEKYTLLRIKSRMAIPFMHLYALIVVVMGWGIFYYEDLGQALNLYNCLFGNGPSADSLTAEMAFTGKMWIWIIALIMCLPIRRWAKNIAENLIPRSIWPIALYGSRIIITIGILILSTCLLVGATNNAFIYTRF